MRKTQLNVARYWEKKKLNQIQPNMENMTKYGKNDKIQKVWPNIEKPN